MGFKIVGVVARARHGKDTVADVFLDRYGFKRISLADQLKEDVAGMFKDFPAMAVAYDGQGRISYPGEAGASPEVLALRRRTWQVWGTEGRRQVFPDYWLWQWSMRAVRAATGGWPGVVVADIRFQNEAAFVRSLGGAVVAVDRGAYMAPGIDYTHASEREIPEVIERHAQIVIPNLGTLAEFKAAAAAAAEQVIAMSVDKRTVAV